MRIARALIAAALLLVGIVSTATAFGPAPFAVTATIANDLALASSGTLVVTLDVPPHLHVNAARPTFDYLIPTTIAVEGAPGPGAPGVRIGTPRFPSPKMLAVGGMNEPIAVYDGSVRIRVPITVDPAASPGPRTLRGTVRYQACDDQSCYPPVEVAFTTTFTVTDARSPIAEPEPAFLLPPPADELPVDDALPPTADTAGSAAGASAVPTAVVPLPGSTPGLPLMLLFAFLGGLLLNLMPCVLPVLSLKIMSLIKNAHESRGRAAALGLAYTGGVLVSFWSLAALILVLRSAGAAVGWGFQFQNPHFVTVLSGIVTAFALSLFGAFEINLPGAAGTRMAAASSREGVPGAFLGGVFATLLATPCTAPFLGAAMGFAFAQPAGILIAAFTAAALGLALPYLLLVITPAARRLLPRPGAWMERLKQGFGFLMLATLLWLWFVLGQQAGVLALIAVAGWNLVAAFAIWSSFAAAGLDAGAAKRWTARLVMVGVIVGSWFLLVSPALVPAPASPDGRTPLSTYASMAPEDIPAGTWIPYDADLLAKLRAAGRTVFVDATADWCLTCKVNERTVLKTERIQEAFLRENVVLMIADWTLQDHAVTDLLAGFGRAGVPFYVLYPGTANPITLPELLTASIVEDALARGRPPTP